MWNPETQLAALARQAGLASVLLLAARLMLAAEFVFFGAMKFKNAAPMQAYMEARGVPGDLVWLAAFVQVVFGAMIATGLQTRLAALCLSGFCLIATGIFHSNFTDLGEVSDFTKDIATAGGFLMLLIHGPGAFALDARRSARLS